jgi:hypothetical protein
MASEKFEAYGEVGFRPRTALFEFLDPVAQ